MFIQGYPASMINTIYEVCKSPIRGVKSYVGDKKSYVEVSKSYIGDTSLLRRVNKSYGGDIKSYIGIRIIELKSTLVEATSGSRERKHYWIRERKILAESRFEAAKLFVVIQECLHCCVQHVYG